MCVPPLTTIALQGWGGVLDPLDAPGFKVGVSFVMLIFGAGDHGSRPEADCPAVSQLVRWQSIANLDTLLCAMIG